MSTSRMLFLMSLVLFIISCGKEISNAIANNQDSPEGTINPIEAEIQTTPWRITRQKLDATSSDELKDQICKNEYGSDYVAGVKEEAEVLVGWGVDTRRTDHVDYGATVVAAGWNKVIFQYDSSQEPASVFCIRKAQWRVTRAAINSDASNEEKDQLCAIEFGKRYIAGHLQEARFFVGWLERRETGYNGNGKGAQVAVASWDKVLFKYRNPIEPARLFCTYK